MSELDQIRHDPRGFFKRLRGWQNGAICPVCGHAHCYESTDGTNVCAHCRKHFSLTSNTPFHSTKVPLVKWLEALYYLLKSSRGISSYNLARYIGVTQPTAWRMLMRLRALFPQDLPTGEVCLDEIYIGAEWKWIPTWKKAKLAAEYKDPRLVVWGPQGYHEPTLKEKRYALANSLKRPVVGIIEYNSRKLFLGPLPRPTTRSAVIGELCAIYEQDINSVFSHIITDQTHLYDTLTIPRSICNHSEEQFVSEDGYSSNKVENVFTNLRRMLRGVYGWFSEKYTQHYLREFCFRFSHPRTSFGQFCDIISYSFGA